MDSYADSGYVDAEDGPSSGGCCIRINGTAVSYHSSMLTPIPLSTTEAEYYSLSVAAQDAVFVKELLDCLGFPGSNPIPINQDNQSGKYCNC